MAQVCVFDVNETLLDVGALDPLFAGIFLDSAVRREWFDQMILSAMLTTVTDQYRDFGTLGWDALQMVAARRKVSLPADARSDLAENMKHLPPQADAVDALERLKEAGCRMAALTNSTQPTADAQLTNASLRGYFEQALSADSVQRLKPAREPYHYAAAQLGVAAGDIVLIAVHSWDVAGALSAGCRAGFVARSGKVLNPGFRAPDFAGGTLVDVAEQIIRASGTP
jgi:2-haloacid dehalogenase